MSQLIPSQGTVSTFQQARSSEEPKAASPINESLHLLSQSKSNEIITKIKTFAFSQQQLQPEDAETVTRIHELSENQLNRYKGFMGPIRQFFSACNNLFVIGRFISLGKYLHEFEGNVTLGVDAAKIQLRTTYFKELDDWATKQKTDGAQEAIKRIKGCIEKVPQNSQNSGTTLNLDGLSLTELPPLEGLARLTKLECLYLNRNGDENSNKIKELPESIGKFIHLKKLQCRHAELEKIPDSIRYCTGLTELDVQNNKLKELPYSIGNCTALQGLSANDNQLEKLPDSIGNCTELMVLDVEKNKLQTLPDSIGRCTKLHELRLLKNPLETIPESIGSLSSLQDLTFSKMPSLTKLPESILKLPNTCHLNLDCLPESVVSPFEKAQKAENYKGPQVTIYRN
ncbi:MAG: leucine-rich repeat domain-containing protein [Chryseobacterium sp.]